MKKTLTLICAALLAVLMLASVSLSAADVKFDDVDENAWYYSYITEACEKELMKGMGDGNFAPEAPLTRAQYITILWRLSGDPEDASSTFTDVSADDWYAPYVGWATKNGVISGYPDNTFRGNNPVSRQELMVMTVRYLDSRWLDLAASSTYSFSDNTNDIPLLGNDSDEIADWAMYHARKMIGAGLIKGDADMNVNPTATATRAQIATVMIRLVAIIDELENGYTVNDTPVSEMAVSSDELSMEALAAATAAIKDATGVDLSDMASSYLFLFKTDESLKQLQYKAEVVNGSIEFSVSTHYAFAYFPQIVADAIGGKDGWAVANGFSFTGTYTLDNARDLDYESLHYTCETNKNPLAYNLGESATFRVSFLSGDRLVAAPQFKYTYATEDGKTVSKTVPGHSGQLVLTFDGMDIPGVGKLEVAPANKKGVEIANMRVLTGSIVYDFYNLKTFKPIPEDFNAFWDEKMAQLDAVALEPLKFEVCPVFSNPEYGIYCVAVPTQKDPAHFHITVPKNAQPGTLKLYGCFDGYGQPSGDGPDYRSDGITVSVNSHSIDNHLTDDEYKAYEEKITGWAFEDPEYLVHMLCRDVQAMKFTAEKFADLWNGTDVITSGGSMGGFQAIGVAALYDKVTACNPGVPWMCDIGGSTTEGKRHGGWRPQYNEISKYVDSTYLATMFDGVVRIDGGLGDYTCPPSGLVCLYNAFASTDKALNFRQTREHGYGGGTYNQSYDVSTASPELQDMYVTFIDNGCAVPAPDFNPDRTLNASEEAMKTASEEMRRGEKWYGASYPTSEDIKAEDLAATFYALLTEKYGLDASCRVEIDIDALAVFKASFQNVELGKMYISTVEYTIYDTAGGYYDAKINVRFTKE